MNLKKGELAFLFTTLISLIAAKAFAQVPSAVIDNLHPTSPTAWQFLKYTDLPVSEYTGIPNITIPLYEIQTDGVKVPLNLTYHASGNRVNEEASWVGLGWDMQIGSIVQVVNGMDDFNTDNGNSNIKFTPDWPGSPVLAELPYRYNYPLTGSSNPGNGWYTPYPSSTPNQPQPYQSFKIATDYYVPINTNFDVRSLTQFTSPTTDSEHDIFKANFLGYSINFILDWNTNQPVVLNNKGYKVIRNSEDTWTIFVPGGEEFDFQQKSVVQSTSSYGIFYQNAGTGLQLSSKIWMLTKIVTKNKKQILFNYSTTSVQQGYPSYSQKLMNVALNSSQQVNMNVDYKAYPQSVFFPIIGNSYGFNYSRIQEAYTYLNTITFPQGLIVFNTSARQDITGGMKLDNITISTTQVIKSFNLNYDYFDATNVGGNGFTYGDASVYSSPINYYRLKLVSLHDNSGATHTFNYNSTALPPKNSFATDCWGYYNGQLSNTSLVPNPAQYNMTAFGNTGDNHSANLTFAQAGILQEIQYPTGGKVDFNYELNAFNNYYVPDFNTSTNTISHGNGLRIQSVTYKQADGTQSKKDIYGYSIGKAILPVTMYRNYNASNYISGSGGSIQLNNYNVNEFNPNGAFSASYFGSITGVGYDTVSHQKVDLSGNPNGKTVSIFFNNPDIVNNSATSSSQLSATLPALKQYNTPDNGSLKCQTIYDALNNPLKRILNSYSTINSNIYYAARLFGYTNIVYYTIILGSAQYFYYDQHMIGYYPLFDNTTLRSNSTETDYFGADSVTMVTNNTYDIYNQLASTTKTNSTFNEVTQLSYPYNFTGNTVLNSMVSQNRLSDIVTVNKTSGVTSRPVLSFTRSFGQTGNLIVPSTDVTDNHPGLNVPTTTNYDLYDARNGNILQYTKSTLTNSFIYDYNNEYLVAEIKNAPYTSVAYTSFEAGGAGRWKFTGPALPDNTAPTGKKDYSLSNGNIYRDSLSTTQTYVVSYWSKSGAQTVNGNTTALQGYTYNGWTYYEHNIINPSGGTVTVSGTGTIDELRLYPGNAQMLTYTYEPLVGITSQSDAGARISYYEYDGSMRLLDIRDQSKNILKAFCYNYAGQPTTCGLDITYSSEAQSVAFTTKCSIGYTGSTLSYTLPLGKYTSTMSLQDANDQATADVTANGQKFANTTGNCALNINFSLNNTTNNGYQVNFSAGSTSLTYDFSNSGTKTIQVPSGVYTVNVYPTGAYINQTFTLGSRAPVTGVPRTYFYTVNIATGSTDSSLSIQ